MYEFVTKKYDIPLCNPAKIYFEAPSSVPIIWNIKADFEATKNCIIFATRNVEGFGLLATTIKMLNQHIFIKHRNFHT